MADETDILDRWYAKIFILRAMDSIPSVLDLGDELAAEVRSLRSEVEELQAALLEFDPGIVFGDEVECDDC